MRRCQPSRRRQPPRLLQQRRRVDLRHLRGKHACDGAPEEGSCARLGGAARSLPERYAASPGNEGYRVNVVINRFTSKRRRLQQLPAFKRNKVQSATNSDTTGPKRDYEYRKRRAEQNHTEKLQNPARSSTASNWRGLRGRGARRASAPRRPRAARAAGALGETPSDGRSPSLVRIPPRAHRAGRAVARSGRRAAVADLRQAHRHLGQAAARGMPDAKRHP